MSERRFYLEPAPPSKDAAVLFSFFVKTSGDTVGIVYLTQHTFQLYRLGSRRGAFATMHEVFKELDRIDA